MNKRLWIVFIVVVVSLFGVLIYFRSHEDTSKDSKVAYVANLKENQLLTARDVNNALKKSDTKSDIKANDILPDTWMGNKNSKVVIIQYEDFACSHCQAFHPIAKNIEKDYQDKVLFIRRNFSLGYPNSLATLTAGAAAQKLGGNEAFWKITDLMFSDETWIGQAVAPKKRLELFNEYAKKIGIDQTKFKEELNNAANNGIQEKLDRDKALGEKSKVTGTPTWLVNGKKIDDFTEKSIRKTIDTALKTINE